MEMVINAIYYNPILALHVLESKGWTNKFFSLWFGSIDSFNRVHDKKLCIVAIIALLGVHADQVPASVSIGWPRLLQGITALFRSLPAAEKFRTVVAPAYDDNAGFSHRYLEALGTRSEELGALFAGQLCAGLSAHGEAAVPVIPHTVG